MACPSGEQIEIAPATSGSSSSRSAAGSAPTRPAAATSSTGTARTRWPLPGRGQVLIPWPNRIEDGAYEFDGQRHQLPLNEPEARNAIHGLVRWARVDGRASASADRVVMEHTLHPQPGYPFSLALSIEYALADDGLRVTYDGDEHRPRRLSVRERRAPVPDASARATVDTVLLRAPGRTVLQLRRARASRVARARRGHRLRLPAAEADRRDEARQRVHRSRARRGRARAGRARRPGRRTRRSRSGSTRATRTCSCSRGDPLPSVDRRSLAVEPMTCPPNAFRTRRGV